jgi:hypothetical protein
VNRIITLALSLFIFSSQANTDNKIKLTPQKVISTSTLITTGVPFSKGDLNSINSFSLFDEKGKEVSIYIKPTLTWHFSPSNTKSIRSVKIQFYVDEVNESNNDYTFTYNATSTLPRLTEQPIKKGFMINSNPDKANVSHPIIMATLTPEYLASSDIIPSFNPMKDDNQKIYWDTQFEWAKKLPFGKEGIDDNTAISHWLFDRTTSLYKGCMRTGNIECYIEAFSSYQFWMNSLKRDGTMQEGKGGSLIALSVSSNKQTDTKYVYIEQIKIHLALTGDDTLHDRNLVLDMADLSRNNYSYQAKVDIPYVEESKSFTERAAGLILLAQVSAYEITGDHLILEDINKRVDVLYDHQMNNPDSHPADGTWRHSYARHEGDSYPGDGIDSDRIFSPWMTENIIDALWHTYKVTNDQRIPEMIRYAGEGVLKWGFLSGSGYKDKYNKTPLSVINKTYTHGCNTTHVSPMYFGSSVAPIGEAELVQTTNGSYSYYTGSKDSLLYHHKWYTDSHSPEMVLNLSLALYFETDQDKSNALLAMIKRIEDGYLNKSCGDIKTTERLFNWNNRSNAWGTYLWVMDEKSKLPDANVAEEDNDYNYSLIEYEDYFTDIFSDGLSELWSKNSKWKLINGDLVSQGAGRIIFTPDFDTNDNYTISTTFTTEKEELRTGIIFNGSEDTFYSAKFKSGLNGGIYIKYHTKSWDSSGSMIASIPANLILSNNDKFHVTLNKGFAHVGLNGVNYLTHKLTTVERNPYFGMVSIVDFPDFKLHDFTIQYNPIEQNYANKLIDTFDGNSNLNWPENSMWSIENGKLQSDKDGHFVLNNDIISSDYNISADIKPLALNNISLGVIIGNDQYGNYYSARIKTGIDGGVYIYQHTTNYGGGSLVHNYPLSIDVLYKTNLSVNVIDNIIEISVNGRLITSYESISGLSSETIGFIDVSGNGNNVEADNFKLLYNYKTN